MKYANDIEGQIALLRDSYVLSLPPWEFRDLEVQPLLVPSSELQAALAFPARRGRQPGAVHRQLMQVLSVNRNILSLATVRQGWWSPRAWPATSRT